MPLTTPPGASAPLYARNKVTGETYFVGSNVSLLDDLGDVDTSTTGPTGGNALIWDETLGQWVPGVASTVASLDDLTDVTTSATGPSGPTGPSDGQVLLWDAALGQWIPGSQANTIDDLTDVDTSTTGPVDKDALVWSASGNQWVPGARSIDDLWDVSTSGGATGPSGPTHGQVLVWDETQSQWVPGLGASEVETAPTLPTGSWELWVDQSPIAPPGGSTGPVAPPPPSTLDALTDVDTTTTAPVDGDGLVWDATAGQWLPRAAPPADFLPLAGGRMDNGAVINFGTYLGDKIVLYDSGGLTAAINSGSNGIVHSVYSGANGNFIWTVGGTEVARLSSGGFVGTTINVSYLNGFTGSTSFRVNPAMVTLTMMNVVNGQDIYGFSEKQVCALPAGVPAPFATVSASGATYIGSSVTLHFRVEVRSTGVYVMTLADNILTGDLTCSVSLTWSR